MPKISFDKARIIWLAFLGFKSYREYLSSDLWGEIRRRVLARDDHTCRICNDPATQVHHNSYSLDALSGNLIDQLFSLCRPCHHRLEFKADGHKKHRVTVKYSLKNALRHAK